MPTAKPGTIGVPATDPVILVERVCRRNAPDEGRDPIQFSRIARWIRIGGVSC